MQPGHGAANEAFDIAIIGGGINGCGIARDAAGRGWRVHLCEQGDLGSGTSSASTKLVHGGLRYLEQYEFRLVRESLLEREVLWGIAPHIIWPLRFVLPYHRKLRPRWILRLGLFLYDHIGGRRKLPPTRSVNLARDNIGDALKPEFKRGFEYSDCWVEDSRLVVLNARDAANHGAIIEPHTRCVSAQRLHGLWDIVLQDDEGRQRHIAARSLINASGPWVGDVAQSVMRDNERIPVRLVQGSHIVVPRLYKHDGCYIFQNADKRIFFVIPYEQDFTLLGTTDRDYTGDPGSVHATPDEIAYLCTSASEYLRVPVTPEMVVWTYSGVRPLFDESGDGAAQATTRDYVLKLEGDDGTPPLLTVFGGKITTYRRLAEAALTKLLPRLRPVDGEAEGWTGLAALPGGDFPTDGFEPGLASLRHRYPFLADKHARRLFRTYGTRAYALLGGATRTADLGQLFGADFTEAELRFLVEFEWVRNAADALWRRTKLGLRLSAKDVEAVEAALGRITSPFPPAMEEVR